MANMSYCRFRNTLEDLTDCFNAIEDRELSDEEAQARYRMIRKIASLVDRFDLLDETSQEYFNPASEYYNYSSKGCSEDEEDFYDE